MEWYGNGLKLSKTATQMVMILDELGDIHSLSKIRWRKLTKEWKGQKLYDIIIIKLVSYYYQISLAFEGASRISEPWQRWWSENYRVAVFVSAGWFLKGKYSKAICMIQ